MGYLLILSHYGGKVYFVVCTYVTVYHSVFEILDMSWQVMEFSVISGEGGT